MVVALPTPFVGYVARRTRARAHACARLHVNLWTCARLSGVVRQADLKGSQKHFCHMRSVHGHSVVYKCI
jgi:hypothetical protein